MSSTLAFFATSLLAFVEDRQERVEVALAEAGMGKAFGSECGGSLRAGGSLRFQVLRASRDVRGLGFAVAEPGGEVRDGGILEEELGRHLQTVAARPGRHLNASKRVPPELEEIVLDPDAIDPQQLLPDPDQPSLAFGARSHIGGLELGPGVRRQRRRRLAELGFESCGIERAATRLLDRGL